VFSRKEVGGQQNPDALSDEVVRGFSMRHLWNFAIQSDEHDWELMAETARLNGYMGEIGMLNPENFSARLARRYNWSSARIPERPETHAVLLTMAAVFERMIGTPEPIMALAGSGNQGLAASLPLVAWAQAKSLPPERLWRAMLLSCLITVYIKSFTGLLTPICGGSSVATSGASGGIVFLEGGGLEDVVAAVQNCLVATGGMLCDGAKRSCVLKVGSGVQSAVTAAMMALEGVRLENGEGIVGKDTESTIANFGHLVLTTFGSVDDGIIEMIETERRAGALHDTAV